MQVVPVTNTTVAARGEVFTTEEEQALVGFLAGYSGLTREAYQLDLRQWAGCCAEHRVALFCARRADIEGFGRHLKACGRARATVARRLCTIACFCRYAEEEGLIPNSPAVHVRRPRLDYESHVTGLDRNEVGALLVAAGLGGAQEHALLSLLALNGLRVSEAIGANIEQLGLERDIAPSRSCARAARSSPSRSRPAPHGPSTWPSVNAARDRSSKPLTAAGSTAMPPPASCAESPDGQG
jgi:site-specific recombinase XerC